MNLSLLCGLNIFNNACIVAVLPLLLAPIKTDNLLISIIVSVGPNDLKLFIIIFFILVMTLPFLKDRKSTRLNSSHVAISYAVFCLKKKRSNPRSHEEL